MTIETNSYYIHQRMKKQPNPEIRDYADKDADYCIKSGITIGPYEEGTIEKQGWSDAK